MKGFEEDWQHRVGARLVGRGRISGRLYDLGEYPAAVATESDSGECVKGELYAVRDVDLATKMLDEVEEFFPQQRHKSLFRRILLPVTLDDGRRQAAWVYVYNRPINEARLVPSGDYRDRVAKEER
jgi:gamma-glutamylcyclotransferase (GGCT)/AIG2-like uncharacterized protein YtfP